MKIPYFTFGLFTLTYDWRSFTLRVCSLHRFGYWFSLIYIDICPGYKRFAICNIGNYNYRQHGSRIRKWWRHVLRTVRRLGNG